MLIPVALIDCFIAGTVGGVIATVCLLTSIADWTNDAENGSLDSERLI